MRTAGMAVASLVLGIISLGFNVLFVPTILAIVFGFVALGQIKNNINLTGRGMAVAGIICGIIGALIVIILITAFACSPFIFVG